VHVLPAEEGIYTFWKELVEMLLRCGAGNYLDFGRGSDFSVKLKEKTARVKFTPNLRKLLGISSEREVMRSSFDLWINHRVC